MANVNKKQKLLYSHYRKYVFIYFFLKQNGVNNLNYHKYLKYFNYHKIILNDKTFFKVQDIYFIIYVASLF